MGARDAGGGRLRLGGSRYPVLDVGGLEAESLGSSSLETPSQDSSDWLDTSLLPVGETWTPVPELPSSVKELDLEAERELLVGLWCVCVSIWRYVSAIVLGQCSGGMQRMDMRSWPEPIVLQWAKPD